MHYPQCAPSLAAPLTPCSVCGTGETERVGDAVVATVQLAVGGEGGEGERAWVIDAHVLQGGGAAPGCSATERRGYVRALASLLRSVLVEGHPQRSEFVSACVAQLPTNTTATLTATLPAVQARAPA